MPLRNPKPINWRPAGCSDALDGSESFEGAMTLLQDLVPSQRTNKNWVARPAATAITQISVGNPISAIYTVGDMLYGFVSDGAGHDLPFAYNLGTNTLLPITNGSGLQLITSQPTTGEWIPPTFAQVDSRIVTTHPGFSNAPFNSGKVASWIATAASGSNVLLGGLTPADIGDNLVGTSIAPGATILAITNGQIGQTVGTVSGTIGSNVLTIGAFTGGAPMPGYAIHGAGGQITGIIISVSGSNITYSGLNITNFSGNSLHWSGSTITMSLNAIASSPATGEQINSPTTFVDPSGASRKFGYFDISNASIQLTAQTFNGSQLISMANVFGLQPGMAVSGPGIQASTFIRYLRSLTLTKLANIPNFGDLVLLYTTNDNPGQIPLAGQLITGPGIVPGTQVQSPPTIIGFANGLYTVSVPLSFPASGAAAGSALYTFGGLVSVFLNLAATANGNPTLTFSGGSPSAPIFAIVDTAFNPLPSLPLAVTLSQFGAAVFACGINGMPYTDSLLPGQRSFANQALVPGDGLAITALGSLPLSSPITGGVIQAVIAFAGVSRMYQITGAPQTGNLALQAMNVATGTFSPLSITPTNFGLAFISPEGMRIVGFDGTISDPVGDAGLDQGISYVFISTVNPSRIVGAGNADVIRFTVINTLTVTTQEWCFDITRKRWYGPMTGSYAAIEPWRNTFVAVPRVARDTLANASLLPLPASSYTEFGTPMTYIAQTVLLPDNPNEEAFGVNESSAWIASSPSDTVQFTALDDQGVPLDTVTLSASATPRQRLIPIDKQWVFRQMALNISGSSDQSVTIGRINIKYQELGYSLPNR